MRGRLHLPEVNSLACMHLLCIFQHYDPCFTPLSLKGTLQNKGEVHRVNPWMHVFLQ